MIERRQDPKSTAMWKVTTLCLTVLAMAGVCVGEEAPSYCRNGFKLIDDKCYFEVTNAMSMDDARRYCPRKLHSFFVHSFDETLEQKLLSISTKDGFHWYMKSGRTCTARNIKTGEKRLGYCTRKYPFFCRGNPTSHPPATTTPPAPTSTTTTTPSTSTPLPTTTTPPPPPTTVTTTTAPALSTTTTPAPITTTTTTATTTSNTTPPPSTTTTITTTPLPTTTTPAPVTTSTSASTTTTKSTTTLLPTTTTPPSTSTATTTTPSTTTTPRPTTTTTTPPPPPECQDGWTTIQEGSMCAKVFEDKKTSWQRARNTCKGLGGDLVAIRDENDSDIIQGIVSKKRYWIGLHENTEDGTFFWLDDIEETKFDNFKKHRRKNSRSGRRKKFRNNRHNRRDDSGSDSQDSSGGDSSDRREKFRNGHRGGKKAKNDCVELMGRRDGQWSIHICSKKLNYICQKAPE